MFDEQSFEITFIDAWFSEKHETMVDELQEIQGVYGVTPDIDHSKRFQGISFRVDKNMDLSDILAVLLKNGMKIKTINTQEPTLEDAFIAITGQRPGEPGSPRGRGRRRF
jgi:ABC-type uncharacterized transport system ATPase subunit